MNLPQDISTQDIQWMRRALELAEQAQTTGEVPVGALIVTNNTILSEGWNQPIRTNDPTAHAEIIAMRAAAATLNNYRIADATLYVTLEPCAMCAGAILQARIGRVVYGAKDPRAGAVESVFQVLSAKETNHRPQVTAGILAEECAQQLTAFFKERR